MTTDIERRFTSLETGITGNRLSGYAAVFDSITYIPRGDFNEQLARGAFDTVLAEPDLDVVGLYNHNHDDLLARTRNGSLRLSTDSTGLHFDLDIPNTTLGKDIRSLVEAGLITGCSFGFWVDHDVFDSRRNLRTIESVAQLDDISVVTRPAYQSTEVNLRSETTTTAMDSRTQILAAKSRTLRKAN